MTTTEKGDGARRQAPSDPDLAAIARRLDELHGWPTWKTLPVAMDAGDLVIEARRRFGPGADVTLYAATGLNAGTLWRLRRLAENRALVERERPANQQAALLLISRALDEPRAPTPPLPEPEPAAAAPSAEPPAAPVRAARRRAPPGPPPPPEPPVPPVIAEALGRFRAFTARYLRPPFAPPPPPAVPAAPVARLIETARPAARGPGRAVRPREGESYYRLLDAARKSPVAQAALDEVLAGRISVTQALRQIGLRGPRSHYRELCSVWEHASDGDREAFLAYLDQERREQG